MLARNGVHATVIRKLQEDPLPGQERSTIVDKIREQESKGMGSKMSLEEQSVFLGTSRSFAGCMVCPDLLDYVKLEVERDAKLQKALHTAKVEREERRKKDGK